MEDIRKTVRDKTLEDVVRENPRLANSMEGLVKKVSEQFFENQVRMFPEYCAEAYKVNSIQAKEEFDYGIKGKYTDTYGWSKDGSMKSKWIIPMELKLFMTNIVYKGFWDESNAKVRDSFMRQVCRGGSRHDYDQLLKKVVLYYGAEYGNQFTKGTRG